jgi:hypothetical protein
MSTAYRRAIPVQPTECSFLLDSADQLLLFGTEDRTQGRDKHQLNSLQPACQRQIDSLYNPYTCT